MEKETNIKNIYENIRLDRSYVNYHKIIEKKLNYKFSYLDEWLLKQSHKLLKEANIVESKAKEKYRVYNRGTIIKVDFGVNLGSEMSQVHFAIVMNNYDNTKNNVLTVIPLTSKESKFNLDLGELIANEILSKLNKKLKDNISNESQKKKIENLITYYENNMKHTYACCSLITTISKSRIILPINEYDIIGTTKCSAEVMDKLDNEIQSRFTKKIDK